MEAAPPKSLAALGPAATDRRRLVVRYDDRGFTLVRRSDTELANARFGVESDHTRILTRARKSIEAGG